MVPLLTLPGKAAEGALTFWDTKTKPLRNGTVTGAGQNLGVGTILIVYEILPHHSDTLSPHSPIKASDPRPR